MSLPRLHVVEVAERDYARVLTLQRSLVERVAEGSEPPTLLLVEHDAVVTIGRGNQRLGDVAPPLFVPGPDALRGRPLVPVERGGGVTVHGPGQLVVYPIVRLVDHDVRALLRALEGGLVTGLARMGIAAETREGATGIWVAGPPVGQTSDGDASAWRGASSDSSAGSPDALFGAAAARKIASLGVAVRRFTTLHGLALNVSIDVASFAGTDPCGYDAGVMTSCELELCRPVSMAEARAAVVPAVVEALERRLAEAQGRA